MVTCKDGMADGCLCVLVCIVLCCFVGEHSVLLLSYFLLLRLLLCLYIPRQIHCMCKLFDSTISILIVMHWIIWSPKNCCICGPTVTLDTLNLSAYNLSCGGSVMCCDSMNLSVISVFTSVSL